jgi:hypothetical protein
VEPELKQLLLLVHTYRKTLESDVVCLREMYRVEKAGRELVEKLSWRYMPDLLTRPRLPSPDKMPSYPLERAVEVLRQCESMFELGREIGRLLADIYLSDTSRYRTRFRRAVLSEVLPELYPWSSQLRC